MTCWGCETQMTDHNGKSPCIVRKSTNILQFYEKFRENEFIFHFHFWVCNIFKKNYFRDNQKTCEFECCAVLKMVLRWMSFSCSGGLTFWQNPRGWVRLTFVHDKNWKLCCAKIYPLIHQIYWQVVGLHIFMASLSKKEFHKIYI